MVEEFKDMLGRSMNQIQGSVGDNAMIFYADDGSIFRFCHERDCCESVLINDISGDVADLCGSPILLAELVSADRGGEIPEGEEIPDSWMWSFYKFRTLKGDVTVRWLGTSNGYYSEAVVFSQTIANQ